MKADSLLSEEAEMPKLDPLGRSVVRLHWSLAHGTVKPTGDTPLSLKGQAIVWSALISRSTTKRGWDVWNRLAVLQRRSGVSIDIATRVAARQLADTLKLEGAMS